MKDKMKNEVFYTFILLQLTVKVESRRRIQRIHKKEAGKSRLENRLPPQQ